MKLKFIESGRAPQRKGQLSVGDESDSPRQSDFVYDRALDYVPSRGSKRPLLGANGTGKRKLQRGTRRTRRR